MGSPLSDKELALTDAYWRAANYLSVGQIYLYDNPLLKKPLTKAHIKPRLLGHWGTTPGLNFIYVHLNRVIKKYDLNMLYITGPGHGGPGLVANAYLEGTYSEVYPNISPDEEGMKRLFTQFSFPGGIPSHVAPETPGSMHEGGELGYAVSHAYGAAFDNPDLIVACVVGDGEAETGPLATSWHSNKFLNPETDGVVLPILHLNGYKIANPAVLARISREELNDLFRGYGYTPSFVEGDEPAAMHQLMAEALDAIIEDIRRIKDDARHNGGRARPRWPMIILRTPKGWTCPEEIDGKRTADYWRSHQVPMGEMHENPGHVQILEQWMRSYKPEELFGDTGRLRPELAALPPRGSRCMSANPHTNGGLLLRDLRLPDFRDYAVDVPSPGAVTAESTRVMGKFLRDVMKLNMEARNFRLFSPDENNSNRWQDVLEVTNRAWMAETHPWDDHLAPDGRVMEMLSEHQCQGWLEGYLLTGRHGFFSCYEAFIHIIDSMFNQHAKWLKVCNDIPWRRPIASLNYLLSSHVWRQDHNGFSHQDPGFIDHVVNKKGEVVRVYLPPDANCLLSVTDHCLRSRNYVNVIVAGKQPAPQWLTMDEAIKHCTAGLGIWEWASNDRGAEPDVVMACCGDVPTLETLAAVDLLRRHAPDLKVRVINVVNLMKLQPPSQHPHGLADRDFDALFTTDKPIIFAFHGYPWLIHRLTYRRSGHRNLHVRGYKEEGTTTTPFDMCVLNDLDRFHLVSDVIDRVPKLGPRAAYAKQAIRDKLMEHKEYITRYGDDMPEIAGWKWGAGRRGVGPRAFDGGRQRVSAVPIPHDAILVLNAGSSSIKLSVFAERAGELTLEIRAEVEGLYTAPRFVAHDPAGHVVSERSWPGAAFGHDDAVEYLRDFLKHQRVDGRLSGVGHRVVHGGREYTTPVRVDAETLKALERFIPLAPLHQPHNLSPIALLLERAPELPQVTCFDTSFHRTNPDVAQRFALPARLHDAGVQRYGFHGLSYEYIASALPSVDARAASGKTVVLHLGNGSSMCAMEGGRSLATTMGFTPADGLPMGTRCGAVDPGVIVYLLDEYRMDARAIERLIYHESGFLGVSGISSDMRTLMASTEPSARLAIDLYVYRIQRELGSLAAALGGLDAIVFTAGIGENAPAIRARVGQAARWLGIELDAAANARGGPRISAPGSRVSAWVLPTNEELMIARHTQRVLGRT